MRTTIDIPDPLFRRIKSVAASKGLSLKEFINSAAVRELERLERPAEQNAGWGSFPLVPSGRSTKVPLTNDKVLELLAEDELDALS